MASFYAFERLMNGPGRRVRRTAARAVIEHASENMDDLIAMAERICSIHGDSAVDVIQHMYATIAKYRRIAEDEDDQRERQANHAIRRRRHLG